MKNLYYLIIMPILLIAIDHNSIICMETNNNDHKDKSIENDSSYLELLPDFMREQIEEYILHPSIKTWLKNKIHQRLLVKSTKNPKNFTASLKSFPVKVNFLLNQLSAKQKKFVTKIYKNEIVPADEFIQNFETLAPEIQDSFKDEYFSYVFKDANNLIPWITNAIYQKIKVVQVIDIFELIKQLSFEQTQLIAYIFNKQVGINANYSTHVNLNEEQVKQFEQLPETLQQALSSFVRKQPQSIIEKLGTFKDKYFKRS